MVTVTDQDRVYSTPVIILSIYLIGLLVFRYPLLTVTMGETTVFRPDWLLSLPLLIYAFWNHVHISKTSILFGIFAFVVMLSGFHTGAILHVDYWTALIQLVFALSLFTAILSLDLDIDQIRHVFRFWLILVTIAGLFGLYQSVGFNSGLPSLAEFTISTTQSYNGYNRPNAFYTEPSMFASVLISGIAILLPAVTTSKAVYFSNRIELILLGLFSLALFLAASLGGYLVVIASIVVFIFLPDVRRPALYALTGLTFVGMTAVVVSVFLSVNFVDMIITRFRAIFLLFLGQAPAGGGSVDIRLARGLTAVQTWAQNPLFGTGLGLYDDWIQHTDPATTLKVSKSLAKTHGAWVQIPAEIGIFGIITFTIVWMQMFRDAGGILSKTEVRERVIVFSGICLVITQLISWMLDMSFVSGFRWGLIGLAYAGIMSARERE